ncbi:MAG TPA: thermonuclease family protein [Nitrospira sp.]|nr:thermonuclease family protein [Nitrospira sp.]
MSGVESLDRWQAIGVSRFLWKLGLILCLTMTSAVVGPVCAQADFSAKVEAVHEGDHLTVYHNGRRDTIVLKGIDCPELKQPYGKKARQVTAAYVGNRDIIVRAVQRDRQGRLAAEVILQDGRNVAYELVKEGLAWSRGGSAEGRSFSDEEELARAARKGLWADPNPVPPWKWNAPKKATRKFSN